MPGGFPSTRHSVLAAVAGDDGIARGRALDALIRAYHRPVYMHVRLRHRAPPEEASDLTQAFFLTALEKDVFAEFDPALARFRTFLRMLVDRFVIKQRRDAGRQKRGGQYELVSLDFQSIEVDVATFDPDASPETIDAVFDREWVRSILAMSVEALEAHCTGSGRKDRFLVFERLALGDEEGRATYAQVAEELGLKVTDVTNYLHYARTKFRGLVLSQIRALCASDEEYRAEAAAVLGPGAVA